MATTLGAALGNRRVLSDAETRPLLGGAVLLLVVGAIAAWWPRVLAWPLAALALWVAVSLAVRWARMRRHRRHASRAPACDTSEPSVPLPPEDGP
jgi:cardiolipin synthase